jgi:hypothetical protein
VTGKSVELIAQVRPETVNDVADIVGQLTERWKQSISPANRRLDERFAAGEIHVLLLVRGSEETEVGKIWVVGLERNPVHDEVLARRRNETVLVGVVKLVEQPESRIPVLVWFEPVEFLYSFPPRTLYVSLLSGFISVKVLRDREINVVPSSLARNSSGNPSLNQMEGQVVESAHQVVNGIPGDCRNLGTVDVDGSRLQDWFASIRITIKPDTVGYRTAEGENSLFQVLDVLIGPFNFYANQSESVVCRHHGRV